jgi:inorganic pyrophosphatase
LNYWKNIPLGENPPEVINAVIEVVSGSRDKYEYKSDWEAFMLDRMIPSSVVFPIEYGFVPQTWYDDNDPLDIMVMSYEPLEVGCIVRVRVIGVLEIEDEKGVDSKILSVLVDDARFEGVHDIGDVHAHQLREIQEFFETYKRLEPHKWVKVKGWEPGKKAQEIVQYAADQYQKHKK